MSPRHNGASSRDRLRRRRDAKRKRTTGTTTTDKTRGGTR